jgi:hypothetical protein
LQFRTEVRISLSARGENLVIGGLFALPEDLDLALFSRAKETAWSKVRVFSDTFSCAEMDTQREASRTTMIKVGTFNAELPKDAECELRLPTTETTVVSNAASWTQCVVRVAESISPAGSLSMAIRRWVAQHGDCSREERMLECQPTL